MMMKALATLKRKIANTTATTAAAVTALRIVLNMKKVLRRISPAEFAEKLSL
jgi:hypothetical protein